MENPDRTLTDDINKWALSLSQLYSNVSKPVLDLILFSHRLSGLVGVEGPVILYSWYWISGHFLKLITPAFGKMTAEAQTNEGEYRGHHFDILTHAEEISFYNGGAWENT